MVVKYNFRPKVDAITSKREFHDACFASIQNGDPIMVDVELPGIFGDANQITCMEYILDALSVAQSHNIIDVGIFENLALPSIDLNQNLCHDILDPGTLSTCIPKLVQGYTAISHSGKHLVENNGRARLSNSMQTILARYPSLFQRQNCNRTSGVGADRIYYDSRDYITCFEKVLRDGGDIPFVDPNRMPDGFFDTPMCRNTSPMTDLRLCYKGIVGNALSSGSSHDHPYMFANSIALLNSMIRSKKFERVLYEVLDTCDSDFTCLEKILMHHTPSSQGFKIVKTIVDTYTDSNNIVDTESGASPFSGEKCKIRAYGNKHHSCLNGAIKFIYGNLGTNENGVAATELMDKISANPMFSGTCGILNLMSFISSDYIDQITDRNYNSGNNSNIKYMGKLADKVMYYTTMEPLSKATCMDRSGMKTNGVDYALELGIPILYQLYHGGLTVPALLNELRNADCVSMKDGNSMPCLKKLTTELLVEYGEHMDKAVLNEKSARIIEDILDNISSEGSKYVYPEGGTYFTDYLTDGLLHATLVSRKTSARAIVLLERMINQMGSYVDSGYVPKFTNGGYNRFTKIIDVIDEATTRYPRSYESKQTFGKPSMVRNTLNRSFEHTPEDVIRAMKSGLFDYGKSRNAIDILSEWFDVYNNNEDVKSTIVNTLTKDKAATFRTLGAFFRSYSNRNKNTVDVKNDVQINPETIRLFEYIYKKPMSEYFEPSKESRMLFDDMCFHTPYRPGGDQRRDHPRSDHDFLTDIYDDVEGNSEFLHDPKNINGVYDVTVGNTGMWGTDHIIQYTYAISRLLYGSSDPIGLPYILWDEHMHSIPVGLVEAVNTVSEVVSVGKRVDNIKGKLTIDVSPKITPEFVRNHPDEVVQTFRSSGNDFTVNLYYVDENGVALEQNRVLFKMMDVIQGLPKKLKTSLNAKYPFLLGQLDAVTRMEVKDLAAAAAAIKIDTYKMVISNKPVDIIRCSACQDWDADSCMSIFSGSHNEELRDYLDAGSYIAYLTKESEYEPQWLARMFLHNCSNCNCVNIQDRLRIYEIKAGDPGNAHPRWHILYDAVKTALADKGINEKGAPRGCDYLWEESGSGEREDIEENGDSRCNEYMSERVDECEGECEGECESSDKIDEFRDDVSGAVDEEIDDRLSSEISDDPSLEDDEDRLQEVRDRITDEVQEGFEDDLIGEKISDCKGDCEGNCESVNDDFNCWQYLVDTEEVDDDDEGGREVWTDNDRGDNPGNTPVMALKKGSDSYKSILLERTGQTEDSQAFVKPAPTAV